MNGEEGISEGEGMERRYLQEPLNQNQGGFPKPIETEVEFSNELLTIEAPTKDDEGYLHLNTKDLPKSNLPIADLSFVRRGIILALNIRGFGIMHNKDMTTSANTVINQIYIWIISSRGKNFAAPVLAKTSIFKTEGRTEQFLHQQELKKRGFFSKLFGGR